MPTMKASSKSASPCAPASDRPDNKKLLTLSLNYLDEYFYAKSISPHLRDDKDIQDVYSSLSKEEQEVVDAINSGPKLPPKCCDRCSKMHSPSELCRGLWCRMCYNKSHILAFCPYFDHIPQGAKYSGGSCYEVRCQCGYPFFDEIKWVCPNKRCRRGKTKTESAKLWLKHCSICFSLEHDHNTYNCPKNKELAAIMESNMKKDLHLI